VRTNPHYSRRGTVFPKLSFFEEEVNTALWPAAIPVTVSQASVATNMLLKSIEQLIEIVEVVPTTHRPSFPALTKR